MPPAFLRKLASTLVPLLTLVAAPALAQQPSGYVITPLGPSLFFVGGQMPITPTAAKVTNDLFLVGAGGALLVDGDYAQNAAGLRQALRSVADVPIRVVIDTHYHDDHVGANEALAAEGAVIIAQERARADMLVDHYNEDIGATMPAAPPGALPAVTFPERGAFYFAGEEIEALHVVAHTDSDAILFFRKANVVHMGDTFFNGMFPFFDRSVGGSIEGLIRTCRFVLGRIDAKTVVVPGHGALADREALRAYLHMLETVRHRVKRLADRGMSLEEVVAARPLADLERDWSWFMLSGDAFTAIVYRSLAER